MGYDVHITLADDWTDARAHPILEPDWLSVVSDDPTLAISEADYLDRKLPDGSIQRIHPVLWNGSAFWFMDGEIVVKNPQDDVLAKMVEIAERLGAHVIGDEGETYP